MGRGPKVIHRGHTARKHGRSIPHYHLVLGPVGAITTMRYRGDRSASPTTTDARKPSQSGVRLSSRTRWQRDFGVRIGRERSAKKVIPDIACERHHGVGMYAVAASQWVLGS